MIAWLAKRFGVHKFVIAGLLALAFVAIACFGAWLALAAYRGIIADAVAIAVSERDASWKAEIAAANAEAQSARAEQALAVSRAEARAAEETARLQTELNDLEKANAALAGGDRCGLGRDRVRLLNGAR